MDITTEVAEFAEARKSSGYARRVAERDILVKALVDRMAPEAIIELLQSTEHGTQGLLRDAIQKGLAGRGHNLLAMPTADGSTIGKSLFTGVAKRETEKLNKAVADKRAPKAASGTLHDAVLKAFTPNS